MLSQGSMHSGFTGVQESFGSSVILLLLLCDSRAHRAVRTLQGFVRDAITLRVGRLGKVPSGLQHRCMSCSCSVHGA